MLIRYLDLKLYLVLHGMMHNSIVGHLDELKS